MAVARIVASPRWFSSAAEAVSDSPRLRRELLRAADRRSRMAELSADEVDVLRERFPDDELVAKAAAELEIAQERERARKPPRVY